MNKILSEKANAKVQEILVEQLGVECAQITPGADLMADLGADSLDMVEIAMNVEEAFSLTIPDEDMEKVHTVGDLYEALGNHLEGAVHPV